jgi:dephospho-CoA kinase
MIVGLTGGIGSGKSTVAHIFQQLGITIINADAISRQLLSPDQPALAIVVQHFGSKILNKNGSLNRGLLRQYIFESTDERLWLEALLHPLIKTEILKQCSAITKGSYVIVEVPLLFEAHFQDTVDRILVIDCPIHLQIERVSKRDHVSATVVATMINTQVPRVERIANADDVIENSGDLAVLREKLHALHNHYKKLSM